jgi:GTP-binding protein YchF
MKLGITGLSGSGKATVFEALTRNISDAGHKGESRIGTVKVPDSRIDVLSDMYKPKKTIYAQVEYFLPGMPGHSKENKIDRNLLTLIRDADALIHVIRNFGGYGFEAPSPYKDFLTLDQELVLTDLVVAEKRLERLELDKKRGKAIEQEEVTLLNECLKHLENETPLRKFPELASAHILRGYAFLSAKPMLVLFNNEDDDDALPDETERFSEENCMVIRGKLEQELAQMSEDEAADFLQEFNITASAMDRVIKRSYELLGLISFFTVGEDEVRAWTIKKGTSALDAAEVIHSDIKKGFIRAETLSYNHLMEAGTYQEAKKKGTARLEGKTYEVQDGDIINFRFNV